MVGEEIISPMFDGAIDNPAKVPLHLSPALGRMPDMKVANSQKITGFVRAR
jgi:hypothetical protein